MSGRQNGPQLAFFYRFCFHSGDSIRVDEAKIHFSGPYPFGNRRVIALMERELHLRILFPKGSDQLWQPVAGNAGYGSDADNPGVESFDFPGNFLHGLVLGDGSLDKWIQLFPLEGQTDSIA